MMMSSVLTSTVLRHQRHHLVKPLSLSPLLLPSITTTPPPPSSSSNYSTSTTLHARPGSTNNHADRNPKIKITLEQLRMAARGSGRRAPICHEAQERVMNSLEAAKYENSLIYRYIKEYDKCREEYDREHKGKDRSMMKELNKYLVRPKKKQK
mmetsp:Transcript_567/g.1321  ORF Transcript_567/g.1321 Transcript_567/m.1321 type:complete len:153 (-) Transcript_567:177-635(-)|eukprot:g9411.t1 g9411   contig36:511630-512349(+)